jgi:4-hydroxybenzoate polyprenyltransferase
MFLNTIQLIRVKDWLKNFVIFFPIIFSNNMYSSEYLKIFFLTFVIFSLTVSCIYILNDIVD